MTVQTSTVAAPVIAMGATTEPTIEHRSGWLRQLARDKIAVSAMDRQYLAQEILVEYGVKPTYVIDYPIATQPSSIAVLRSFLASGSCLIGTHLHPWVNPPFDEPVSVFNSYPGNLDPSLERRKV